MADLEQVDFAAWEVDALSYDFEDRVMAALQADAGIDAEAPERRSTRRGWIGVALAVAAALVLGWAFSLVSVDGTSSSAELIRIADRANVFVDPGARIEWRQDSEGGIEVDHTNGYARYEVEPGERFRVVTPAGVVTVTGTVFTVEVESMTNARRKKMLGAAALAGTVVAAVAVLEGSVDVHNAYGATELVAGQSAIASDAAAPRTVETAVNHRSKLAAARQQLANDAGSKNPDPDPDPAVVRQQIRRALTERSRRESGGEVPSAEEPKTRVFGSFDKEYIREVIREDLVPLARECYENALSRFPHLDGRMSLEFSIMGDETVGGVVDHVDMGEGTTIFDPEMTECIRESMLSVVFEPPEGGGVVEVTYPIIFDPGDEDDEPAPPPEP